MTKISSNPLPQRLGRCVVFASQPVKYRSFPRLPSGCPNSSSKSFTQIQYMHPRFTFTFIPSSFCLHPLPEIIADQEADSRKHTQHSPLPYSQSKNPFAVLVTMLKWHYPKSSRRKLRSCGGQRWSFRSVPPICAICLKRTR